MSGARLGPRTRHPMRVSLAAHPTVLPASLGILLRPARWPSLALPTPRRCFGVCVPSQNLGLSFPFPCRAALPVISRGLGGVPLPAFLSLSIPGWTSLSHCRSQERAVSLGEGWGDPSQEESRARSPRLAGPAAHGGVAGPTVSVSFLAVSLSKLVSGHNPTPTRGGR